MEITEDRPSARTTLHETRIRRSILRNQTGLSAQLEGGAQVWHVKIRSPFATSKVSSQTSQEARVSEADSRGVENGKPMARWGMDITVIQAWELAPLVLIT